MSNRKKNGLPPGPGSWSALTNLLRLRKDSLGFLKDLANEYGDIVKFKIGPYKVVLLNHPDYIKEVLTVQHTNFVKGRPLELAKLLIGEGLLTSEGEFHKRQSRMIQPAFHRKMIQSYAETMTEGAIHGMHTWKAGKELDVLTEMIEMSTIIASKTLFGVNVGPEAKEINEALSTAVSLFDRISVPFSELLLKLPLPSTLRFRAAKKRLDATIFRMIQERRKHPRDTVDLLSVLLNAQDGDEGMSDEQVRDEALTLFLTAFDTTSLALTWTWYLLAKNPAAEAELHAELDKVLGGRTPTWKDFDQLPYTRMVLGESLRLLPPIYLIIRQALADFSVGDYVVPSGTIVLMSPYLIHRDARFHKDPDQFNPKGVFNKIYGQKSKYEYFPFGRGPRSCIGESFAWMEGTLVLATIAQKWRLLLEHDDEIELLLRINLRPKNGMPMRLEPR